MARLRMTNYAAKRSMRCVAVGRKNWTLAGSDRGDERAAAIYTLIETESSTESIRVPAGRCARSGAGLSVQSDCRSLALELA
jgi:hypothetical protein